MLFFGILRGRVKYKIKCENSHQIVDVLRKITTVRGLSTNENGGLQFYVPYKERNTVDKILENSCAELLERKCTGFAGFLSGYKKRAGLITGVIVTIILIIYSTQFVWDIRVVGNENVSDAEIVEILRRNGFYTGIRKKDADIEKSVNMMLVEDDRISWAAINFDGTVAQVEVKEARIVTKESKKENINLVASYDGIIIRTDALSGSSAVKKGDAVIKGQMLISAFVEKRTGGYLLKGARGSVWANTRRSYAVVVPLEYNEKLYTGNSSTKYNLSFLGKNLEISPLYNEKYKFADSFTYCKKLSLFGKFTLPVNMNNQMVSEYEVYKSRRTHQEALELAKRIAAERLKEDSPDFVLSDISDSYTVDDVLVYECTFEGVENIAVPLEFDVS